MQSIKLVTYNIRCDVKEDGINQFPFRKPLILKKLQQESPDVIGFQEIQAHMIEWLREVLPQYTIVGCGREEGYEGEHNAIAYKKEVFELLALDTFWLSDTPRVVASRFEEQSICPRICTTVTLKHKDMIKPFRYYNTHLDHGPDAARINGIKVIMKHIEENQKTFAVPIVLTGDLNAIPDSETIKAIEETQQLNDCTIDCEYTYHGYGNPNEHEKIDYIYVTEDIDYEEVKVWDDVEEGRYLSDHYPITATLSFK
ncbi:MAG: endonuclease/exonuclease/phosphatase family protein [Cellulosilyticaceae bacterium]